MRENKKFVAADLFLERVYMGNMLVVRKSRSRTCGFPERLSCISQCLHPETMSALGFTYIEPG